MSRMVPKLIRLGPGMCWQPLPKNWASKRSRPRLTRPLSVLGKVGRSVRWVKRLRVCWIISKMPRFQAGPWHASQRPARRFELPAKSSKQYQWTARRSFSIKKAAKEYHRQLKSMLPSLISNKLSLKPSHKNRDPSRISFRFRESASLSNRIKTSEISKLPATLRLILLSGHCFQSFPLPRTDKHTKLLLILTFYRLWQRGLLGKTWPNLLKLSILLEYRYSRAV